MMMSETESAFDLGALRCGSAILHARTPLDSVCTPIRGDPRRRVRHVKKTQCIIALFYDLIHCMIIDDNTVPQLT
jgi:hypothetical protein